MSKKPIENISRGTSKKHPGGRPTKYKPEYCQEIIDFFSVFPYNEKEGKMVANQLPFLSAFARDIGVCHDTLIEWTKIHEEFSESYKNAKELQKEFLITNGLLGLYNPTAFIFTAKNITDMRDKQEHEHSGTVTMMGSVIVNGQVGVFDIGDE